MNTFKVVSFEEAMNSFEGFDEDLLDFDGVEVKVLDSAETLPGQALPILDIGKVVGFVTEGHGYLAVKVDETVFAIAVEDVEIID